jgi:hypothetical protein
MHHSTWRIKGLAATSFSRTLTRQIFYIRKEVHEAEVRVATYLRPPTLAHSLLAVLRWAVNE